MFVTEHFNQLDLHVLKKYRITGFDTSKKLSLCILIHLSNFIYSNIPSHELEERNIRLAEYLKYPLNTFVIRPRH